MMHAFTLLLTVLAVLLLPPILVCLGVMLLMFAMGPYNDL